MKYLDYLKWSYESYKYDLQTLNKVSPASAFDFGTSTSAILANNIKMELIDKMDKIQKEIKLLESVV